MYLRIILAASVLALAGCAGSSKVMVGQARPPIDPAQVQVYTAVPPGSQEIAQLEASSAIGFGTQGQTDAAVERLKREAAALGANGVVLIGVGSASRPSRRRPPAWRSGCRRRRSAPPARYLWQVPAAGPGASITGCTRIGRGRKPGMRQGDGTWMRRWLGAALMAGMGVGVAAAAMGQEAAQVTAADYERAVSMLGERTLPLVDGLVRVVDWLDDGSVLYQQSGADGVQYLRLQPGQGAPVTAFTAQALATAMDRAAGGKGKPADPRRLPVTGAHLDAGVLVVSAGSGDYRCEPGGCQVIERAESGREPGVASPDGSREAFVRDWNL